MRHILCQYVSVVATNIIIITQEKDKLNLIKNLSNLLDVLWNLAKKSFLDSSFYNSSWVDTSRIFQGSCYDRGPEK